MALFSVARNALLLALTTSSASSFLRPGVVKPAVHSILQSWTRRTYLSSSRLFSTTSSTTDTPTTLPVFASKEEYLKYMESIAGLPKGFATGTAQGTFIPEEAPAMGPLPIRATVIRLEEPTENWAAVFTKNKVSTCYSR